jgi:hypothetical protein
MLSLLLAPCGAGAMRDADRRSDARLAADAPARFCAPAAAAAIDFHFRHFHFHADYRYFLRLYCFFAFSRFSLPIFFAFGFISSPSRVCRIDIFFAFEYFRWLILIDYFHYIFIIFLRYADAAEASLLIALAFAAAERRCPPPRHARCRFAV